ncbi:MAG: glycosyltransferase family 2 protein [Candidatus Niyogibacteria bacterium]|nr:glycosyltransferase family 2 protein [Candidatus Niyogibacteria bacterium]
MYRNQRISVVMPVYNEAGNIRTAIEDFFSHPIVDEVIAVNNNSADGSADEIKKTRARYILETTQGYGSALRRGMREATGDIIVTVEPDGTFIAKDLEKLLIYSDDFDVVFGTRTSRALIWSNANMGFFLRMGNWAVAKFLEYLFNGPSLTDVGCTYKLIRRYAYEMIKGELAVSGGHFSPEFMIRILQHKVRCVEVPVHYRPRVGVSKITGKTWPATKLGFRMIVFIVKERVFSWCHL